MGGADYWSLAVAQITQQAMNPASLGGILLNGSQSFITEWPLILDEVHDVNPDANVVALTLYNPIEKSENAELYNIIEELIAPMNQALRDSRSNKCSLANVYNAFRKDGEAVDFSLAWAPQLNPHPTELGQQLIYNELVVARNAMAFQ